MTILMNGTIMTLNNMYVHTGSTKNELNTKNLKNCVDGDAVL